MTRAVSFLRRDDATNCGSGGGDDSELSLRVVSIFVILVGSSFGALFPVLSRRTKWLSTRVPKRAFDTAKYFGSGVIVRTHLARQCLHLTIYQIATAFIHLLNPAIEELGSPCLSPAWQEYVSI
jgi:solute carrier family 39 (zinc transporter), member 1/2/3